MSRGTVRWFDDTRAYDCIFPNEVGEDLLVHHIGVSGEGFRTSDEGDEVSRQVPLGREGMQAGGISGARAAAWGCIPRFAVPS